MMRKPDFSTVILGGGTFNHIRNHLSLAAPAFGSTAKNMYECFKDEQYVRAFLCLTKMADSKSDIVTNDDVSGVIDHILEDKNVDTIIMNVALCDFEASIGDVESGSHAKRLKTKDGNVQMTLTPSEKIIGRIHENRPDIFLVGFKTTTGASSYEQLLIASTFMKSTNCNLVLANDVVTRNNMIIASDGSCHSETTQRFTALNDLCDIIQSDRE